MALLGLHLLRIRGLRILKLALGLGYLKHLIMAEFEVRPHVEAPRCSNRVENDSVGLHLARLEVAGFLGHLDGVVGLVVFGPL